MPQFTYKARTAGGEIEKGTADAANREELMLRLREQGLFCFEMDNGATETETRRWNPIKLKLLAPFCRQLSTMLRSGVNMSRALDIIYDSSKKKPIRDAALNLYEGVHRGQSLSETMKDMGNAFPELLIYMVETGEASGTLDAIMEKMANHYESEMQLKRKIQGSLIYPVILAVVAIASVTFMLVFALPQILSMYNSVELPGTTRVLLAISEFLTHKYLLLLAIIAAVVVVWKLLMTQRRFKVAVKKLQLKMPVFGKLMRTIYTSRFASTFSVLYGSGISILKSIDIAGSVLGNAYIEERLKETTEDLTRGDMLSESLNKISVFDPIFLSMVTVGEESGALEEILAQNGEYFDREANAALSKMVSFIEPIMILIMGVVIGFIVISIIMPIFTMYTNML